MNMDPDRWQKIEQIYNAAMELEPDRREAWLAEACAGDESLRKEVEDLLGSASSEGGDSGDFMKEPAMQFAARALAEDQGKLRIDSLIGKSVGHYRIVEKIGEGGMGVVYRARDMHLGRSVAIKVLPPEAMSDPERKRRFVLEAKTASALNHPNIIQIHDINSDGGVNFIVMEHVAGKTLDRRIGRRGLPLGEALKYGTQIADALAAAHAAGIVHRDLKPANIMVTGDGAVKLLDFGLAKLTELTSSDLQPTSWTTKLNTEEGVVVGTVAYMSPEQAEGRPVDARSDIFSFGSVLYEMATGRRAFQGDSKLATLSAVLHQEPRQMEGVPHDLQKIIGRCLRKDPEKRIQSMKDVKLELEELEEESESGQLLERAAAPAPRRWWLWAFGAAAVVLLGAGLWFMRRHAATVLQQTLVPVTTTPGSEMYPSFSPDGRQIAFFWDGDKGENPGIYVKLLGQTIALRLTAGADSYPAWSPDGKRIAFVRGEPNGGIYTVSALGGEARPLSSLVPNSQMSWSPDGKLLALSLLNEKDRGILLLPVEGGEPRRISNPKPPALDRSPAFAPDGDRLAYVGCTADTSCDVYVQALSSGYSPRGSPPQQIRSRRTIIAGLTWSRDGRSITYGCLPEWTAALAYLWRVGVDGREPPERLEVAGPRAFCPSASPTANRLVFHRLIRNDSIWRYRANDGMEPLIVSSLPDVNPQFSPDGTRIVFASIRSAEGSEIWVAQADGSKPVQMTDLRGRAQGTPRWSPDGRWIAFDSVGQDGHSEIYAIDAAGGLPRKITSGPFDERTPFWSQDGKWIYFRSYRTGGDEIWRVPFAGGQSEQVTTRGGFTAFESVDGKSLFYTKAGHGPLFARQLSGGEEREVLPYVSFRAFSPVADGIYYIGRRSDAGYYPLEFFQFSSAASKLLAKIEGGLQIGLSVSPDRKTILFTKSVSAGADLMMIEDFQ